MDAMKYSAAGVETYFYYFDFEAVDLMSQEDSADDIPGLPHASELFYTFGAYKNPFVRGGSNMGSQQSWEVEIGYCF